MLDTAVWHHFHIILFLNKSGCTRKSSLCTDRQHLPRFLKTALASNITLSLALALILDRGQSWFATHFLACIDMKKLESIDSIFGVSLFGAGIPTTSLAIAVCNKLRVHVYIVLNFRFLGKAFSNVHRRYTTGSPYHLTAPCFAWACSSSTVFRFGSKYLKTTPRPINGWYLK